MPSPQVSYYNFVVGPVAVVTTAETVISTTRAVSPSYPGALLFVKFYFQFTFGTGTTSVVVKIERGAVAGGTAIYTSGALTAVAGNIVNLTAACTDQQAGDSSGQVYVCTVTQAAATGNGAAANIASEVINAL